MHGGKSPRGLASPNYRHGRYSRSLPTGLLERYQAAVIDPELLNLTEDIGAMDAILSQVAGRLASGETGQWIQQLVAKRERIIDLFDSGQTLRAHEELGKLFRIIDDGATQSAAEKEFAALLDKRRKLVESERKRRVEMGALVTVEEAMLMISTFIETVKLHVRDNNTLIAIAEDFERAGARLGLMTPE